MSTASVASFAFGPSAGGGLDPGAASNKHIQFNADTGTFENDAGTDPTENNDNLAFWDDQSGNGFDATQTTDTKRPTWLSAGLDSQPVVDFPDTALEEMSVASSDATIKPFSVIAVVSPDNFTDEHTILGASASGGIQWRIDITTGKISLLKGGVASIGTSSTALTSGQFSVVGVTYDASGNFAFYLNGAADGTGTNDQTFSASNFNIGNKDSGTEFFGGPIADIYVFDTAIKTSAEMIDYSTFLNAKYSDSIY